VNSKISKSVIIFSLIVVMFFLDLWQKNENYNHFLLLKKTYLNSKKNNKKPKKERGRNMEWPSLLKIWNQKAQELNCQIRQIQSKNSSLNLHEFQIKISGQFFDLLRWLRITKALLPQVFWTRVVMTIKDNHQLQMIVEGGQHV